jgi:hypothetical protein
VVIPHLAYSWPRLSEHYDARMSTSRIDANELAELLQQTGDAHHGAYQATDGTDPEWASWYAGHLQALVGERLARPATRSEVAFWLVKSQQLQEATESMEPWPHFYANLILAETAT